MFRFSPEIQNSEAEGLFALHRVSVLASWHEVRTPEKTFPGFEKNCPKLFGQGANAVVDLPWEAKVTLPKKLRTIGTFHERVLKQHANQAPKDSTATLDVFMSSPSIVLRAGCRYRGEQKGPEGRTSYPVEVEVKHVDYERGTICGYLTISQLTAAHPVLTTFFEGEIIDGKNNTFLTRKWHADERADKRHWGQFPSFAALLDVFNTDGFCYEPSRDTPGIVFMRWKELFLVPDHKIEEVEGASYSGFYYMCLHRDTNTIRGFYYPWPKSEVLQEVTLKHEPPRISEYYDFR